MRKFGARALKWPFSSKEVAKILEEIEGHKSTFTMALTSDTLTLTRLIDQNVSKLGSGISEIHLEQRITAANANHERLQNWLSAPDPSSNHNAACKTRQEGTGNWLLDSEAYRKWQNEPRSCLWLHGIPGCGKSVLCSTVIESVKSQYKSDRDVVVAYYYFSFSDSEKQKTDKLIRSLLEQLARQSAGALNLLDSLYADSANGNQQPSDAALHSTLKRMINMCREVFIIIDALDECVSREDLLESLITLPADNLHILVTSRKERDIERILNDIATKALSLQGTEVDNDIQSFISHRLQKSPKLSRWPANVRSEIENTLTLKAKGMFRWIVCQMDVLEKCVTINHLRNALSCLPKTLDDTYERILDNIDTIYHEDAFRLFQWLVYSERPLRLKEFAEVLAVDTKGSAFDPEQRVADPHDILEICSSLVITVSRKATPGEADSSWLFENVLEVHLAHFSVKEYLESDRMTKRPEYPYSIQATAQAEITRTCLAYLLHFQENRLTYKTLMSFPLAQYAARYWVDHFRLLDDSNHDEVTTLVMQLFESSAFYSWIRLSEPELGYNTPKVDLDMWDIPQPLYYALHLGLEVVVSRLIESGVDVNFVYTADDGRFGYYDSALAVASSQGHGNIVALLLENKANPNQSKNSQTPLQVAIKRGDLSIVSMLLHAGANINDKGGDTLLNETPLLLALDEGHETIVNRILDTKPDIDTMNREGRILSAAATRGYTKVVARLLEMGIEVDGTGERQHNALKTNVEDDKIGLDTLLYHEGDDFLIHYQNYTLEYNFNPESSFDCRNDDPLMQWLETRSWHAASRLLQTRDDWSALELAVIEGHQEVIALLLQAGADPYRPSKHSNAFELALEEDSQGIVALLLEAGKPAKLASCDSTPIPSHVRR